MSLKVEHVNKRYKSALGNEERNFSLKDISFILENGNILALVGQNGAGKTTLIKCILNLLRMDSGEITLNDMPIERVIANGELGFMPESLKFPDMITLKDYVRDLLVLRGKNFDKERFFQLADKLYLTKHLDKDLTKYSKGTMKKAAFIQAIIHQPQLLILDEPTDGLDPVSRRVVLNELLKLKEDGCTIIITTHLLSDLAIIADEIVVLQNGSVINHARREEIKEPLDEWYLRTIFKNGGMEEQ